MLFWGIIGALVMRGALIVVGSALITNFQWIMLLFGAFLIFSGYKMLKAVDAEPDLAQQHAARLDEVEVPGDRDLREGLLLRPPREGVLFMPPPSHSFWC